MALISSLAAPSAPQFQSLIVNPVARVTATLMSAGFEGNAVAQTTAQALGGAELPTEAANRPVLPPASSEAIFKGLLPLQPALEQAADVETDRITSLTEVDGISLDGIPYLNDGAVLLDDLPQAEPEPAPKAKPAQTAAMSPVVATPLRPEVEVPQETAQVRSDQAERAYHEERDISGVRAVAHDTAPSADMPEPKPAIQAFAATGFDPGSVDKRA